MSAGHVEIVIPQSRVHRNIRQYFNALNQISEKTLSRCGPLIHYRVFGCIKKYFLVAAVPEIGRFTKVIAIAK